MQEAGLDVRGNAQVRDSPCPQRTHAERQGIYTRDNPKADVEQHSVRTLALEWIMVPSLSSCVTWGKITLKKFQLPYLQNQDDWVLIRSTWEPWVKRAVSHWENTVNELITKSKCLQRNTGEILWSLREGTYQEILLGSGIWNKPYRICLMLKGGIGRKYS